MCNDAAVVWMKIAYKTEWKIIFYFLDIQEEAECFRQRSVCSKTKAEPARFFDGREYRDSTPVQNGSHFNFIRITGGSKDASDRRTQTGTVGAAAED